jgi:cysteine-rich repeat protein
MRWGWLRPAWALALVAIGAWAASCALDRGGHLAETNDDANGSGGSGGDGRGGDPGPMPTSSTTGGGGDGPASSSSSTTTSSGMGGMGEGGGQGGDGALGVVCGDGMIVGNEMCDDGNANAGDGCAGCNIEPGWLCSGQPSTCQQIMPTTTQASGLPLSIPDDGYNGTMASGACGTFNVSTMFTSIQYVRVTIAASHTWVGDLVIKLRSPANTTTTLMSRPGLAEPSDGGVDSVNQSWGDASNLGAGSPVTFRAGGMKDAETMGDNITGGVCCQDDMICSFTPNPGMGPGTGLGDFDLQNPNGTWQLCIGDASPLEGGNFAAASLEILAW